MPRASFRLMGILGFIIMPCALFACTSRVTSVPPTTGMIKIVQPKDGTEIKSGFLVVKVRVSNFTLQPPGTGKKPNSGHIHYWLDNVTNAMIMGPTTQTTVDIFVPIGDHKLRAELVQDDHASLADGYLGQTIRQAPSDSKLFTPRPTMDTITVSVVR
jgi:hypothetical protein